MYYTSISKYIQPGCEQVNDRELNPIALGLTDDRTKPKLLPCQKTATMLEDGYHAKIVNIVNTREEEA